MHQVWNYRPAGFLQEGSVLWLWWWICIRQWAGKLTPTASMRDWGQDGPQAVQQWPLVINASSCSAGSPVSVIECQSLTHNSACFFCSVCGKWKCCCFKLCWCFINMLNDHTGAVFSHYTEVHKAWVMDGNSPLKDLLISQLNMGEKNHCLFMRSWK